MPAWPFGNVAEVTCRVLPPSTTPVPDTEITLTLLIGRLNWILIVPDKVPLEVGPNTTWNEAPWPGRNVSGKAGPETANWEELLTTLAIANFRVPVFMTVNPCGELNALTFTDPKLTKEGTALTPELA
jgi:hypothetical protein